MNLRNHTASFIHNSFFHLPKRSINIRAFLKEYCERILCSKYWMSFLKTRIANP